MDLVDSRADILSYVSGVATDDSYKKTILLSGLLPEFEPIKLLINHNADLDFDGVCDELLDYGRSKDILELKRHGAKKEGTVFMATQPPAPAQQPPGGRFDKRSNRGNPSNGGGGEPRPFLTLEQKAKLPCPRWSVYSKCRWGKDCHYSHAGPGGTPADAVNLAKKGIAEEASQPQQHVHFATEEKSSCFYCQSPHHRAQECPAAQDIDHTYMAVVETQDPTP